MPSPNKFNAHAATFVLESGVDADFNAENLQFVGTAVRFRSPHFFLTCAHVAKPFVDYPATLSLGSLGQLTGLNGEKLSKITSRSSGIDHIAIHPTADLAVLKVGLTILGDHRRPFLKVKESVNAGDQVRVAGFTRDLMAEPDEGPLAVAFTTSEGSIKQTSPEARPLGEPYVYEGAVMNDTIEQGMSGASVFDWWTAQELLGIATGENRSGGGWLLRLGPYRQWLEEAVNCQHGHDDWSAFPEGFSCDGHTRSSAGLNRPGSDGGVLS